MPEVAQRDISCITSVHVDDLKAAGPPEQLRAFKQHLEAEFGEAKHEIGSFLNCGVLHEVVLQAGRQRLLKAALV